MQNLLIIQQDEAYFLFETLEALKSHQRQLDNFKIYLLVKPEYYQQICDNLTSSRIEIFTDPNEVLKREFDISVNLSLLLESWKLHASVTAKKKIGPQDINGQIFIPDLWSSFYVTIKAKAPFLTFHLQDIYKNILGLTGNYLNFKEPTISQIAFGLTSTKIFSADEQERFICDMIKLFPRLPIRDLSEIDLSTEANHTLYIGPATIDALKLCAAGGAGIFLAGHFQGFNYLPYREGNYCISSGGNLFKTDKLLATIEQIISGKKTINSDYSVYRVEHQHIFGAYLKSCNQSDHHYPIYQSHLVLWNFLLNLFDITLDVVDCTRAQLDLLKTQHEVLSKFLRLHQYAMVSIDTIYKESKSDNGDQEVINGHLKNLREIDQIAEQIAHSHSLLRPVLDFYRIRRGQNDGKTLLEQAQHSFLSYSEEHQALEALQQLFSVTLVKNEVNI